MFFALLSELKKAEQWKILRRHEMFNYPKWSAWQYKNISDSSWELPMFTFILWEISFLFQNQFHGFLTSACSFIGQFVSASNMNFIVDSVKQRQLRMPAKLFRDGVAYVGVVQCRSTRYNGVLWKMFFFCTHFVVVIDISIDRTLDRTQNGVATRNESRIIRIWLSRHIYIANVRRFSLRVAEVHAFIKNNIQFYQACDNTT